MNCIFLSHRKIRSLSLLIVIAGICLLWHCSKAVKSKAGEEIQPIQVKVIQVSKGPLIQSVEYKGSVFPWKKANITSDIVGRIHRIYKKPGDSVKKGLLLAELDATTPQLMVKQANAALNAAKATYDDTFQNHGRISRLFENKVATQSQLEKSSLALETAKNMLNSAQTNLDLLENNLRNCFLRAPFDGVISAQFHEEGDIVNPLMPMNSLTGILELMDLGKVKILLDVPSEEIEKIVIGQPCLISVNNIPGESFSGVVYSKNMSADLISKTFKVEVEVQNPGMRIKPGVFANTRIEISRKEQVLLLPLNALLIDNNISYVVLYDNGVARYKNVRLGEKNHLFYEILGGVSDGQWVVVEGNYDLLEKTPITFIGDDI